MTIQNPAAFLLLLFIPLYIALRKAGILQKPSYKAVLADWNGTPFEWKDSFTKGVYALSRFLIYFAFIMGVIAFSDPVKKHQEKIYTSRGTDILFVLDTSPSMMAKDMNGKTRFQTSKDTIENLIIENTGTRYGLVTLGTEAAVIVPPTNDSDIFISRLRQVNPGAMGDGSAIGTGISTATYHLISSAAPKRCIMLFTDGENNAGDIHPETAATIAADHDITLYVFGIGSKGTVSIDYTDPVSGKKIQGYLDSNFDSNSLRKIALCGNGKYFETATQEQLVSTLDIISRTENLTQDFIYKTILDSFYKKFLILVAISMILAWIFARLILRNKWFNILKSVFWTLSFICILGSLSNLSRGTNMVPVYKSSNAVSLVFDISNSMLAKDEENKMSRLDAAAIFSKKLLSRIDDTPVSVVLAKGDGITAIPLTEDFEMIDSLINSLSPALMTAPGTSLGKGISAAAGTFPDSISSSKHIWVFTDGEETDNHLKGALSDCIKKGINIRVIGFGTENGVDLSNGDSTVHTTLQSEVIIRAMEDACKKMPKGSSFNKPEFLKASDKGTGTKLISSLDKNSDSDSYLTYEEKPVSRYKIFLIPAFIFFVLGIIVSELRIGSRRKALGVLMVFTCLSFTGCKESAKSAGINKNFKGALYYHQNELEKAEGEFLDAFETASEKENRLYMDYGAYNLSATYLLANEDEAALSRLGQISEEANNEIKFAAFFNAGVISFKKGNRSEAAEYFKKALLIDSSSVEAKINLELSLNQNESPAQENEAQLRPSTDSHDSALNDMEETIFERIKENDQKQWKNSENVQHTDYSKDF